MELLFGKYILPILRLRQWHDFVQNYADLYYQRGSTSSVHSNLHVLIPSILDRIHSI